MTLHSALMPAAEMTSLQYVSSLLVKSARCSGTQIGRVSAPMGFDLLAIRAALDHPLDRTCQLLDDGLRRAGRSINGKPGDQLESGQACFPRRGNLRQHGMALGGRHRKRLDQLGLQVPHRRGRRRDEKIDLSADQVVQGRTGPPVWHVPHAEASDLLQLLAPDVLNGFRGRTTHRSACSGWICRRRQARRAWRRASPSSPGRHVGAFSTMAIGHRPSGFAFIDRYCWFDLIAGIALSGLVILAYSELAKQSRTLT